MKSRKGSRLLRGIELDYKKILDKLEEHRKNLETLKGLHHSQGREKLDTIHDRIVMYIRRIYPSATAEEILKKFFSHLWIATSDDKYHQDSYLDKVKDNIRTIDMIKEEFEIMGLDDFTPKKEKIETTVGLGKNTWGFRRKTTKQK